MNQTKKIFKLAAFCTILALFLINQNLLPRGAKFSAQGAKPTPSAPTLAGKQQSLQVQADSASQEEIDALWQALNALKSSLEETIKLDGEQEKDLATLQDRIASLEAVVQNLIKQMAGFDKKTESFKNATAITSEISDKQKTHAVNPTSRVEKRAQAAPVIPDRPAPTPKTQQPSVQPASQNDQNYQAWLNAAWPNLPEELKQIPKTPQEAQAIAFKLRQLFDAATKTPQVSAGYAAAKDYAGAIGQGLQGIPPATAQSAPVKINPMPSGQQNFEAENYDDLGQALDQKDFGPQQEQWSQDQ